MLRYAGRVGATKQGYLWKAAADRLARGGPKWTKSQTYGVALRSQQAKSSLQMDGAIDAADAEESKSGSGMAAGANLGNATNPLLLLRGGKPPV